MKQSSPSLIIELATVVNLELTGIGCTGAFRFRHEGDRVRLAVGGATRQDHPDSGADEHRPARLPRHRRQSPEEGRRAAHAAHGGRPSVRKHHAD